MSNKITSTSFSMKMNVPTAQKSFDPDQAFEEAQDLLRSAKFVDVERLCRKIVNHIATHDRAWHMLGFLALQKSQPKEALELLEKSKGLGSTNPLMFMHLGIARAALEDIEGSIAAFKQATEIEPALAPAQYNLGLSYKKIHMAEEAEIAFQAAVKHDPDNADAWSELGTTLLERGGDALIAFDKALASNPNHVGALNMKAMALHYIDQTGEAITLLKRAISLAPNTPDLHVNYGDIVLLTDGDAAIDSYRKALEIEPTFPNVKASIASALERMRRFEEARTMAQEILQNEPTSFLALMTLVRCDIKAGKLNDAAAHFNELDWDCLKGYDYYVAQKTRSIVLTRQGDYAGSFQAALKGNQRKIKTYPAHQELTEAAYQNIEACRTWFTRERTAAWPAQVSSSYDDPVFFVGFPRSGTTLMEQMLKVHPHFVAAGENDWIRYTFETLPGPYPECLDDLQDDDIERLRAIYWDFAHTRLGDQLSGKRIIDKMPLNILNLGFIRRIFPQAKILISIRDPRDCVLSGFMQIFQRSIFMDEFLTLQGAARFYDAVMGSELHYRESLGLDILEYKYEDLVAAPRMGMENILAFLEGNWDDAVLNHHVMMKASETIATPSMRDVSEAVYTRSTKRWLNYQQELEPVADVLKPYIETFGFET